jgi:glycosyltransferase involved in cell wall biosynthesis
MELISPFEGLPTKEECRLRLDLPLGHPIVGYIGRFQTFEMEKGIPELIQAMTYLPSFNGNEPVLLCVGGPMNVVPGYLDLARRFGLGEHRLHFFERVRN